MTRTREATRASASPSPPLLVERRDGFEVWTINLPEMRNPISSPAMIEVFLAEVDRVGNDMDVGAVIVTGAGKVFSAGGDVRAMREQEGLFGDPPAAQRRGYQSGIQRLTRSVVGSDVPLIAAVNGPAIGAGFDLALMCDIRIAGENASFAESFVRLGLIPGDGGAWLLPRIVGHARASDLALTGRRIDAYQAKEWGIVSDVLPADQLLPGACEIARELTALPREAVRMTKALLRDSGDLGLDATLNLSAAMQPLCHTTVEYREAVDAFGAQS